MVFILLAVFFLCVGRCEAKDKDTTAFGHTWALVSIEVADSLINPVAAVERKIGIAKATKLCTVDTSLVKMKPEYAPLDSAKVVKKKKNKLDDYRMYFRNGKPIVLEQCGYHPEPKYSGGYVPENGRWWRFVK